VVVFDHPDQINVCIALFALWDLLFVPLPSIWVLFLIVVLSLPGMNSVVKISFYQLRQLAKIKPYLHRKDFEKVIHAFGTTRPDD